MINPEELIKSCEVILKNCGDLKPEETILIICDKTTAAIGELFYFASLKLAKEAYHVIVPAFEAHGKEPPGEVVKSMLKANLVCGLTKMSMAQSNACRKATLTGVRYLSLPDYSYDVLLSKALCADFRSITPTATYFADAFTKADSILLLTENGASLRCGIAGRTGNAAPGWCFGPGVIASPPDCEANIAVVESESTGRLLVDGSITHPRLGLLTVPIEFFIEQGKVKSIKGYKSDILKGILSEVGDERALTVAEFGVGLNPLARLCGKMLEDEGTLGTVHIGLGSNWGIGGASAVPFHLDMVIKKPTVILDGNTIIENGLLMLK